MEATGITHTTNLPILRPKLTSHVQNYFRSSSSNYTNKGKNFLVISAVGERYRPMSCRCSVAGGDLFSINSSSIYDVNYLGQSTKGDLNLNFAKLEGQTEEVARTEAQDAENLLNQLGMMNFGGIDGGGEDPYLSMKLSLSTHKWRMLIAYDGTRFSGWQFQESPPTIQCIVEKALIQITKLERRDLHLVGASRTDAGVHAWGQVAHFVTPFNYDKLESIHAALNGLLPSDIRVREISPAVPEFHARFSAKSKIYHYKIYNDTFMDPFQRNYAYHSFYKLNVDAMRKAAKHFVGKHDFSAFVNVSRNDRSPDPVKNIFRFDVIEMGPLLQLEVEGSGFLYRQVRNMVAILLQIGREAIPPDIVPKILATGDRKQLAKYALSVPPHGLCLVSVNYDKEHLRLPTECPSTSFGRHHTIRKCKLPSF